MAQDFCTAFLELTSSETSCIFDKMFEVLLKESAEVREFLKLHKLASDELKASEILPLVKAFEGAVVVSEDVADMWKWSPVKALEHIKHEFEIVGYPLATLKMYLKNNTKEIFEAGKSEEVAQINFATLLTKKGSEVLLQKCEVEQVELVDALKDHKVEEWEDIILEKFLEVKKECGPSEDKEFTQAMKFVNTLSYAWNSLKIVETIPKMSDKSMVVPALTLAEIFAGNYSLVPSKEPRASAVSMELVSDKAAFEQLSQDRKLQVSHFLCGSFDMFNNTLIKSVQCVFDKFNNVSLTEFDKELASINSSKSIYTKNNDISKVFKEIQTAMSSFAVKDLATGMNAILYGYIPTLMKYKKSVHFNAKLANNMMYCNSLKIIGVASKLNEPIRSYIDITKAAAPVAQAAKAVKATKPKHAAMVGGAKMKGGFDKFTSKDEEYRIYKPNSSTGKYLKQLRQLQIDYNNKFTAIYREVLDKLDSIKQDEITSLDNVKAATIVAQFEKILISSNRTTVYLSGILPTKNYSKQFIDAVNNLGKLCKTIGGCFDRLVEPVFKFVKLGRETTQDYQKIRSEYLESSKDASEMLINSENLSTFTVKCDLKKADFIRKIDACQRIFAMCNNRSGVKMGSTTAEMLRKYISGMTDRDKMISEYFDSYESGIKYILSQTHRAEDLALIKPLISMKMILVDETKKAYLWLNQYLDKFLVDKRMEQLGKASLDKETIERIANAFVEFKKYSKVGLDELIRKYRSFLSSENPANVSVNSYFKLFKLAKQTFEEVDAFTYLEKLYNELGITEPNFNWANFKSKLIGYLINGMIWFDIYEYSKESPEFTLMQNVCEERGSHLIDHINPSCIYSIEDKTIPEEVRKFAVEKLKLEDEDLKYRMKKIVEILNMGCEIFTKQTGGKAEQSSNGIYRWTKNGKEFLTIDDALDEVEQAAETYDANIPESKTMYDIARSIVNSAIKTFKREGITFDNFVEKAKANPEVAKFIVSKFFKDSANFAGITKQELEKYPVRYSDTKNGGRRDIYVDEATEYSVEDDFDLNTTNHDKYLYHYTNYGHALKKICMTNGNYMVGGVIIGFSMRHLGKVVSLFNGFESYVIESMYTPIIQIIDKYIIQRYQGSRDYSTNTNDLLQGGYTSVGGDLGATEGDLKRSAGSVFDIVEPHEPMESDIISQAVPFYISSYVILNYYARTYGRGDEDMQLKLSISSLSPFSDPTFKNKISNDGNFKIADEQELKVFVSVMNEYWNSTSAANDKEKVIKAVEHIISELNSMLIFGNDEKLIRLQESGIDESHLDIYTTNFAKIRETLIKTIGQATTNLIRKGINNNAVVESYFAKKTNEVKEGTPSQRIGILKQILYDIYDPTKQDANNEYTSFIDMCVTPMFIINEIYKSCIDMTKFTFNQNFLARGAEDIAEAQLNQTKEFNKLALIYFEKGYKTVGEIIKHLFDEYYRDFDQTLHNIMNFPGLTDGQIKSFVDNVHETFKSLTDKTAAQIKTTESFKTIEKVEYIKDKILIPDTEIQAKLLQEIYIDDTVFVPDTDVFANKETKSFTQFVVNVIASLNPSCFVPQIFSDLLKSSSLVNNTFEVMAKPKYVKKDKETFNPFSGKCLSTYIMCMSTAQTAASQMASSQMTQTVANKYVAAIPMLIAVLSKCSSVLDTNASYKVLIDKKNDYTNYQNINARTEIGILIDILAKTYNDILPFSGEIQFMNGSTTTFSHYLSEIRHQLVNTGLSFKTFIQQPEKYEWIFERACPELKIRYKSYDRFRDYKEKFAIILNDITFGKQFEVLLNVIAKNIFRTFFSSITFDTESSGNTFGRLMGGNEEMNINTILNTFGLPSLKNVENSVLGKLFDLAVADKVWVDQETLQTAINNIELIEKINESRATLKITSEFDSAYVNFANNTVSHKDVNTISAPFGAIEAGHYIITQSNGLIRWTSSLPEQVRFKVVDESVYEKEVLEAFQSANYGKADIISMMSYIKANATIDQYEEPCSCLMNDKAQRAALLYYDKCFKNNDGEEDYSNVELKPIVIPVTFTDEEKQKYPGLEELETLTKGKRESFSFYSPFDQLTKWRILDNYKKAFAEFKFLAIVKAWEEMMVETKYNFKYSGEIVDDFNNKIGEQLKNYPINDSTGRLTNRDCAVSIIYDDRDVNKRDKFRFSSLIEFMINVLCYNDKGEIVYPSSKNMPPCKGFWNLFGLPQEVSTELQTTISKFNFIIRSNDTCLTTVKKVNVNSYVETICGTIPEGKDYLELLENEESRRTFINNLMSVFTNLDGEVNLFNSNNTINNLNVMKMAISWCLMSKENRKRCTELFGSIITNNKTNVDLASALGKFITLRKGDGANKLVSDIKTYTEETLPHLFTVVNKSKDANFPEGDIITEVGPNGYEYPNNTSYANLNTIINDVSNDTDNLNAEDLKIHVEDYNEAVVLYNSAIDKYHDQRANSLDGIIKAMEYIAASFNIDIVYSIVKKSIVNSHKDAATNQPDGTIDTAKSAAVANLHVDEIDDNDIVTGTSYKDRLNDIKVLVDTLIKRNDNKLTQLSAGTKAHDRLGNVVAADHNINYTTTLAPIIDGTKPVNAVDENYDKSDFLEELGYDDDTEFYIERLTNYIHNYLSDDNNLEFTSVNQGNIVHSNEFIIDIIDIYTALLTAIEKMNNKPSLLEFVACNNSVISEIFNDLIDIKNTKAKFAKSNISEDEKQTILLYKMINVYNKYLTNKLPTEKSLLAYVIIRGFANVIHKVVHTNDYGFISPNVECSTSFVIQPFIANDIILESVGLLKYITTFNNDTVAKLIHTPEVIGETNGGEIAKAIDETFMIINTDFAKLGEQSDMVKGMTGGDLEDVDSTVLLNMYSKSDDRFKKFLSTTDAELETMIIAYFNKPLLSFNTYFNKNVFVEIIYNSALFKTSLMKIHDNLKGEKNKYWARLIDAVFENDALMNPKDAQGRWISRTDIAHAEAGENSVYGAITQPTTHRKFFEYKQVRSGMDEEVYDYLNRVQGNGLSTLLLKIDACNEAVGTLAQWIKNFTFTNVEYNDEETFTKYDYDNEPFGY